MSEFSIKQYQSEVEKIIHFGGTNKETAIRNAFYNLLNEYARQKGLMIVTEIEIKATNSNRKVTPDGTLKDVLRQDWGYWESKDEDDNLDEEIRKKFDKGYPKENILFEDSQTAVLIQSGIEVMRVSMKTVEPLHRIITTFINFERPEVQHFRRAIELFKQDIPKVTDTLRGIIIAQEKTNPEFIKASEAFLKLCHDSINPNIINEDVREMIIQHILTEDVFNTIFDENQFHRENNIARELEKVIHTFFTGSTRKVALASIQHYYQAINAAAAGIADHHEKQKFLKVIYETFYKSYNPRAADRLGVVYTPNEIVQFMIKSTDFLLHKHFNKFLEDKGVDILDPATGTGTFICDMIDYMGKDKLTYKYENELHANEIAILPYYISNLNIEYTYTQKMGNYSEFENLCFVDTLDNMGFSYRGKQIDLFSPFTEENTKRIKNQNDKKIAVIIGNPPYNAKQENYNFQNSNKAYEQIDKRIRETFIKYGTAQNQIVLYDMYTRFYRWAFDRLDNNGIVAFVTNRSFIDSRAFDGFRKTIQDEFDFAYIIDTKSDVRANPKIAGTTHNVFGIQTGVAITFLVKKVSKEKKNCNIYYVAMQDDWRKESKLQWLSENPIEQISFAHIRPEKNYTWINQIDNDFETLIPLVDRRKGIFKNCFNGIQSNRDEWVYSNNEDELINKIEFFIDVYNGNLGQREIDKRIKWTHSLQEHFDNGIKAKYSINHIKREFYRPFIKQFHYCDKMLNHRLTKNHYQAWGEDLDKANYILNFAGVSSKEFHCLMVGGLINVQFMFNAQNISLYNYDKDGNRTDCITDWGMKQFVRQYGKKGVSRETIFHYIYAVLHNPAYRKKYELNLKRHYPRIPFYPDFKLWSEWGSVLTDLHVNFETAKPYNLKEISTDNKESPKVKLKADKEDGLIVLDENTTLIEIPNDAWTYKLGNRSALEWILDQYKESKPKDTTIAEKFNTYKFADYKDQVIDLIKRVCTVSVETVSIVKQMEKLTSEV